MHMMDKPVADDAVLLDLRGLEPSPERVLRIVEASVRLDVRRIVIDWGGRFPWSLDTGVRPRPVFPEELVAAVDAKAAGAGKRLSTIVRTLLPEGYSGRDAYRHIECARTDEGAEWQPALEKLASDVVEDLCSLMPTLGDLDLRIAEADRRVLERVAARAGLTCRCAVEPADSDDERGEYLGGVEERLWRTGHPAALGARFGELHEGLRRWRRNAWLLVGALHEDLVSAALDPACAARGLTARGRLEECLANLDSITEAFTNAYTGLAADGAVDRFFHRVRAPLREQYGHLWARAQTMRMRYPGETGTPGSIEPPA